MSVGMIHGKMNHVTGDMNAHNGLNGINGAHVQQLVDLMAPEKDPEDAMEEALVIVDIMTGKISHATHSLAPEPDSIVCDDVIDTIEFIDVINDIFVPEGLALIPIVLQTVATLVW